MTPKQNKPIEPVQAAQASEGSLHTKAVGDACESLEQRLEKMGTATAAEIIQAIQDDPSYVHDQSREDYIRQLGRNAAKNLSAALAANPEVFNAPLQKINNPLARAPESVQAVEGKAFEEWWSRSCKPPREDQPQWKKEDYFMDKRIAERAFHARDAEVLALLEGLKVAKEALAECLLELEGSEESEWSRASLLKAQESLKSISALLSTEAQQ